MNWRELKDGDVVKYIGEGEVKFGTLCLSLGKEYVVTMDGTSPTIQCAGYRGVTKHFIVTTGHADHFQLVSRRAGAEPISGE